MSTTGDVFSAIKKLMLVSEELTRQASELERLAAKIEEHGERLVRVETILSFSAKQNRLILPGS